MEIRQVLREFITTNFWVTEKGVADDESLVDSGILDSTGVIEVVKFIETTFGIAVADGELVPENLETIARISAFVSRRLGANDGATGNAVQSAAP